MKSLVNSNLAFGITLFLMLAFLMIQPASIADQNTRIETEREFREKAVGKKLVYKKGEVTVHDDGTLTGIHAGKKLSGSWSWKDEYYCRTGKVGKKDIGHDCQVVEQSGNNLIFIRKKGKGKKSTPYQIEPES